MLRSNQIPPIRVVVADDHPIVQRGLKDVITAHPHLEVIATASNFRELIESLPHALPDVLVLDLNGMRALPYHSWSDFGVNTQTCLLSCFLV